MTGTTLRKLLQMPLWCANSSEAVECSEVRRLRQAVEDATIVGRSSHDGSSGGHNGGERPFLEVVGSDVPWEPLEGNRLRSHPDPLGALQRGEVPALLLRGFVPASELAHATTRMQLAAVRMAWALLNGTGVTVWSKDTASAVATVWGGRHAPPLLTQLCGMLAVPLGGHPGLAEKHLRAQTKKSKTFKLAEPPMVRLCAEAAVAEHPVCRELKAAAGAHPLHHVCADDLSLTAFEYGLKLYGNLGGPIWKRDPEPARVRDDYLRRAEDVLGFHAALAEGCEDRWCGPQQAMLHGLRELAALGRRGRGHQHQHQHRRAVPTRTVGMAREEDGRAHSPGTLRQMRSGWSTPIHFDSKHANAWAVLRNSLCGERVYMCAGNRRTTLAATASFRALTRHAFGASAILTLHAPSRDVNPVDLAIYRHRHTALLRNCSVGTQAAYGVGARLWRSTLAPKLFEAPVHITAAPGDLFLFNSEFLHDTPVIRGASPRTVFNSFAGFSSTGDELQLYA